METMELKTDSSQTNPIKLQMQQALLQLLTKKTIDQITIHEITDLVYLNRTSFYRYYVDIYDLYYQLLDNFLLQFQQKISVILQKLVEQHTLQAEDIPAQFFYHNQKFLQILLRDATALERLKRQQKVYLKELLHISEQDTLTDYRLEFFISGQIGLISYWFQNQMSLPLSELFNLTKTQLLDTLLTLRSQ